MSTDKITKVLLVEDNPMNQELIKDILELEGYRVLTAGDGETALKMAAEEPPDLVLMDISLPGMDGITTTRKMHQIPGFSAPVVAVTANAMRGDRERIRSAGCVECLTKPINTRTFFNTIRQFLPQP